MTEVPEKDRDGRTGASHRPCPRGTAWHAGSVTGPSTADRKILTENASRLRNVRSWVRESLLSPYPALQCTVRCVDHTERRVDHSEPCVDPSGSPCGHLSSGAVVLEHDRARASGGWTVARNAQRAERVSGSPERRERSEASDRPRSAQGASARDSGSGAGRSTISCTCGKVPPKVQRIQRSGILAVILQ